MITLEDAKKGLERAKQKQLEHECANDMYYTSGQYKEDQEEIKHWEMKIKEIRGNNRCKSLR